MIGLMPVGTAPINGRDRKIGKLESRWHYPDSHRLIAAGHTLFHGNVSEVPSANVAPDVAQGKKAAAILLKISSKLLKLWWTHQGSNLGPAD